MHTIDLTLYKNKNKIVVIELAAGSESYHAWLYFFLELIVYLIHFILNLCLFFVLFRRQISYDDSFYDILLTKIS